MTDEQETTNGISPLGEVLAGPCYNESAILSADLDMDALARGKFDFDVVGHYARPDICQLHVNTQPTSAVIFGSAKNS